MANTIQVSRFPCRNGRTLHCWRADEYPICRSRRITHGAWCMGNIRKAASLEGGTDRSTPQNDAVKFLKNSDNLHEPMQRSTTNYTGKRLDERISSESSNLSRSWYRSSAPYLPHECQSCLKRHGPWGSLYPVHGRRGQNRDGMWKMSVEL